MLQPPTIADQAAFLDYLIARCVKRSGEVAEVTYLYLEEKDVTDLQGVADRLRRMAPHEQSIKRMVVGR